MHGPSLPSDGFLGRLKSHKVIEWTLAYVALAYTLLHGVEMVGEALSWPHWIARVLTLVLILGVPIIATLAWYHGSKGLKRISGPELAILTVLLFIAGTLLWVFSGTSEEHKTAQAEQHAPASSAPVVAPTTAVPPPTAPPAPRTAVAVLPFANLTGDASKEYLGDGMADELINTLTKVQGLKVPARTSTFAYKGRNTDIRQIAKDLGVGTILEGSVKAAGKRIRITAQLINAQDGLHLWSESYDEEFTDIFKLQDKLAIQIAKALQPNLRGAAADAVSQAPPTQDVEAYNLYLQGVALVQRTSAENAARAVEYFQRAIDRDPKFARAYAGMADAYLGLGSVSFGVELGNAAERAALRALALDPNLANAHEALAGVSLVRFKFLEGDVHDRAAVALAPNDGITRVLAAFHGTLHRRRLQDAIQEARKAYELAPTSPIVVAYVAYTYAQANEGTAALKYAATATSLGFPKDSLPLNYVYWNDALHAKRYAEAAAILVKALSARDAEQVRLAEAVRLIYAALADPSQKSQALAARSRLYPSSNPIRLQDIGPCLVASSSYALLGANDVAYELANQCLDRGTQSSFLLAWTSWWWMPELRGFREDSRFQAFATRLGWMDYWQQYGPPDECELKNNKLMCH
jgi:TolB-like protein